MRRSLGRRPLGVLAACACASVACRARDAAPPASVAAAAPSDEPLPAFFACLHGDSAVYSDIRIDSISGDTTGMAITFWRAGDGLDGVAMQTSDSVHVPIPLTRIQLSGDDSIALDLPHPSAEPDTIRFLGRISCERLWGRQRNRREMPSRAALYTRSY